MWSVDKPPDTELHSINILNIPQGLNFQLAAVILSVGVYAYIENSELYYIIIDVFHWLL